MNIRLHLPLELRVLHLDCDRVAVDRRRAVHLRERGGRNRFRLKVREGVGQRGQAELGLDGLLHRLEFHRRRAVLAARERLRVLRRQHVVHRGDKLAELDVEAAV